MGRSPRPAPPAALWALWAVLLCGLAVSLVLFGAALLTSLD